MPSQPTTTWLRQRKTTEPPSGQAKFNPTHDFMRRLKREAVLEGHLSCVNCIEWNRDGSLLASGSDDRTIIIWDPFKRCKENTVITSHEGTIFSVKFMPNSCDTLVASCDSDHSVKLTNIQTNLCLLDCTNCHSDRVKRLAVHQSEPNLLLSAGEDGLILQYDMRESHACRDQRSRNTLIDLKSIFPSLKAKCLAINPANSNMLAVGATDIFNRLFDRRYLKLTNKELYCTGYFAPGHLLKSDNRPNYLQSYGTTYLSFSPDGSELLASVHAEQVYLFDLIEPWERYKTFDHSLEKLLFDKPSVDTFYDLDRKTIEANHTSWKPIHWTGLMRSGKPDREVQEETRQKLEAILASDQKTSDLRQTRTQIECVNSLLKQRKSCPDLYITRAKILLSRGWRGDYYQAMRDCCCALALDPLNQNIIRCLAETFTKLGHAYSTDGLIGFIKSMKNYDNPNDDGKLQEALDMLENFKRNTAPEKMQIICDNNNECDILMDNGLENSSMIRALVSNGGLSSCADIEGLLCSRNRKRLELKRAQQAYDYTQRFCGHCNMNTDIKEANFLGPDGDYIISGSDDGAFYIWDKKTGNIIKAVDADRQILNCVQPHPNICMLATSGIESSIRLWSPTGAFNHDVRDLEMRCMQNQKYIAADPLEAMILMLYPDLN